MTEEVAAQFSYPDGVKDIPYASYLQIKRWSYDQAQKEVMQNQADASGLMANAGTFNAAELVEDFLSDKTGLDVVSGNKAGSTENRIRKALANEIVNDAEAAWQDSQQSQKEERDWSFDADEKTRKLRKNWVDLKSNVPEGLIDEKLAGSEWAHDALAAEEERKEEFARAQAGLVNIIKGKSDYANLALPNEFQYGYGADWSNTFKLGTLALLAENPSTALALAAGAGGLSMLTNFGTNFTGTKGQAASQIGAAFAGGVKTAVDPFSVGTKVNATNLAGLAGLAPNENAMQFFKKMDFRQFDLNFQMAARSAKESTEIEKIIQWFKVAMHPGTLNSSGSSALLSFPDVFELVPKFVAGKKKDTNNPASELEFKPIRHPMMPKTKLCALTNLKINTTPMAQLQTVFDGTIPLITMNLTFTELTALTKADFGLGQMAIPEIGQSGLTADGFKQRQEDNFFNY